MTLSLAQKAKARINRYLKREDGASLLEFALVISLFMLMFFAILDFGRLGFNWVMTEKAMQRAVRIAAVRPPMCAAVKETHERRAGADPQTFRFGSLCRDGSCFQEPTVTCTLAADNGTAILGAQTVANANTFCATPPANTASETYWTAFEIFCSIKAILPSNAEAKHVQISYSFDPNLGFLGGPYTPSVEASIVTPAQDAANGLYFQVLTPIAGLANLLGGAVNGIDNQNRIAFPDLSASAPGEDMAQGTNG